MSSSSSTSVEECLRSLSLDYLNLLINGQAFSDVTFSVEGRLVHAHRCILAARSLFFRRLFHGGHDSPDPASPRRSSSSAAVIPVNSVGYEVFTLMLQFMYTGQVSLVPQKHQPRPDCREIGCWHMHCSSAVDLALDTLSAARSFGVDQLALLTQRHLGSMVEKASMEDVMRVLLVSAKHEIPELCSICSQLVAKSGLPSDLLAKHLPIELAAKIDELRHKSSALLPRHRRYDLGGPTLEEQRIRRMRRALDSSDVELIKLMVMSEGLNLDSALALHYAVQNCSREVVKALLELGVADVNFPAGPAGKTPLHIAAEMVSPDMVAVLLDHHADPNVPTVNGVTSLDILRTLTSDFLFKGAIPGLAHMEPNKLRLCLELVQSAVSVISREEGNGTNSSITSPTVMYPPPPPANDDDRHRICSGGNITMVNLNHDDSSAARTLYLNLGAAVESSSSNHHNHRSSENSSDEPPPATSMYRSHHHHY
ncbi:hypothetical protein DM860_005915 [Cuscuta australis]|uniref:BTB domain-containing protein n=1 Tax=Cuscuta australis TaxID=267555 RepID=A0A328DWD0_9ASTE|nr:hypothetical protein DM860_005915 [Cuscuta australis]